MKSILKSIQRFATYRIVALIWIGRLCRLFFWINFRFSLCNIFNNLLISFEQFILVLKSSFWSVKSRLWKHMKNTFLYSNIRRLKCSEMSKNRLKRKCAHGKTIYGQMSAEHSIRQNLRPKREKIRMNQHFITPECTYDVVFPLTFEGFVYNP